MSDTTSPARGASGGRAPARQDGPSGSGLRRLLTVLIVVGVVWIAVYLASEHVHWVKQTFHLNGKVLPVSALGTTNKTVGFGLIGLGLVMILFLPGTVRFVREVVAELKKVVRPTRAEVVTYTSTVLVFVVIVMAFVMLVDFGAGHLTFFVFG